jgi:hypothetical protein
MVVAIVAVALISVSGCQRARLGARCRTTDLGDDGGAWVLQCKNGRWVRLMTKVQAANAIAAINAARNPPAPPPPPAPPKPTTFAANWSLDSATAQPDGTIRVTGWFYRGSPSSLAGGFAHLTVNGEGVAMTDAAGGPDSGNGLWYVPRPDVRSAFGLPEDVTGFDGLVESSELSNNVCLSAPVNGPDRPLACTTVSVDLPSAYGVAHSSLESVTAIPGGIHASGWALLSHLPDPVEVWLAVSRVIDPPLNGQSLVRIATQKIDANITRPDVGALFPSAGSDHGFDTSWTQDPGTYRVCIDKDNSNGTFVDLAGINRVLSLDAQCVTVTIPA